nr:MAG TPA: hypothetical protein [Caudoviricetes sp.]
MPCGLFALINIIRPFFLKLYLYGCFSPQIIPRYHNLNSLPTPATYSPLA